MFPFDPPVGLDRAEAQRQAAAELAHAAYRAARPSWIQRLLGWLVDKLNEFLDRAGNLAPGGWWGILGLAILVVAVIALVRWKLGPVAKRSELRFTVDPVASAGQHRALSEQAAAAGRWDEAITERMRAVARAAEERELVVPRPGRTAMELAREVGDALPAAQATLETAAQVFAEVRYGGQPGDASRYQQVVNADEAVASNLRPKPQVPA